MHLVRTFKTFELFRGSVGKKELLLVDGKSQKKQVGGSLARGVKAVSLSLVNTSET